jgi:hypothetical protein
MDVSNLLRHDDGRFVALIVYRLVKVERCG